MVFGASLPGSSTPHSDVLTATPQSLPDKLRLVDEIKSRGRAAVQHKHWPDADALYGKGIEVLLGIVDPDDPVEAAADEATIAQAKKDLAILFSNRSLALYNLGGPTHLPQSRSSATSATEFDPTYVKGYWRLGQACAAMEDWGEALAAYEAAAKLDENNKALKKEIEKIRVKVEQERLLVMEGKFDDADLTAAKAFKPSKAATVTAPAPTKETAAASKASSSAASADSTVKDTSSGEFTKSDHVRGYKIINGKKTSYFHNELTEEAKALIGDIAPQKLDVAEAIANEAGMGGGVAKIDLSKKAEEGASAWNKAGTWEEKDVTSWAAETLQAALTTAEYNGEGVTAKVVRATKMSVHDGGHASVAAVRGKKRYIYEFGFELTWELTAPTCDGSGEELTGKMVFPDIDGTCVPGDGYDMTEFTVDGGLMNSKRAFLNKHVKEGGLRKSVEEKIDGWVELFRATY